MYSLLFEVIHNSVRWCVMCSSNTTVGYCVGDPDNYIHWRCSTCIVDINIDYTKINIYVEAVVSHDTSYYIYYDRDMVAMRCPPHNSIFKDPNVFGSALDAFTLTKI